MLVIGVELLSRLVNWQGRTTCVLFGDCNDAVVHGAAQDDGRGILSTTILTDGSLAGALHIPGAGLASPSPVHNQRGLWYRRLVASDEERKKSIKRAQTSGLALAAGGINALLPGGGSLSIRLGQHVVEMVTAKRLARLEDFHRRVFEGDVADQEISDRFRTMEDGDFQHLLTAMLTDIETDKVPVYSAVYIHLVENIDMHRQEKQAFVLATQQLQLADLVLLQHSIESTGVLDTDDVEGPVLGASVTRLRHAGVMYENPGVLGAGLNSSVLTKFGRRYFPVIERPLRETVPDPSRHWTLRKRPGPTEDGS